MRIVIDLQGAQTQSRYRGIGRYSVAFAKAIARNRGPHEVLIVLSGLFPETIEPLKQEFAGLVGTEQILVWNAPARISAQLPDRSWHRSVAALVREDFIRSLHADVVHITSLFEGYVDDGVASIGLLPATHLVSVSLYDLIPLLNPKQYLDGNALYKQFYLGQLEFLKAASLKLAISQFARQESLDTLTWDGARVVNVSTAVDDHFVPLKVSDAQLAQLQASYGITKPFVMYTGGADERKNLPRLIEAFAKIPARVRSQYQLVLAGKMPPQYERRFKAVAKGVGLNQADLVFTGYVSDTDLVLLYNACALFVFPSWHEGFGLPALEAMACGRPVICSNSTSLVEVMAWDEAMFDPMDVQAIASKITHALTDAVFCEQLRANAKKRVPLFSWDHSGKAAITAFEAQKNLPAPCSELSWPDLSLSIKKQTNELVAAIANLPNAPLESIEQTLLQLARSLDLNHRVVRDFFRPQLAGNELVWRLEGPFDSSYSLALVNRELARALSELGHEVLLHSTEGSGDFEPNPTFLKHNPDLAQMHERTKTKLSQSVQVTSRFTYPPRVADLDSPLNLVHGYAWEESGFPREWVNHFNDYLQGISVCSQFVKKVLIDNGVNIPISVMGLGVDHWERIVPDHSLKITAKPFRFLHVSSGFPRKGLDALFMAYGNAFTSDDPVSLVVKTFPNPHNLVHEWLADARAQFTHYPEVVLLNDELSDAQLKALHEQCHALVAPSRAEGFGFPLAEAMLSHLPVITTGWGGQADFCNEQTAWLVDYEFASAQTHFELFDSVWVNPSVRDLARCMRLVYEASDDVRNARTSAAKRWVQTQMTWRKSAQVLESSARAWSLSTALPTPKIAWVSTWNTRCGIASYSRHLVDHLSASVRIFAPQTDALTQADEATVVRCWRDDSRDNLESLLEQILAGDCDVVVLQFNYGFFEFLALSHFLEALCDVGKKVVITLHATVDPVHLENKKLSMLASALARCDRILVHSIADLNRLKNIGLVQNVTLFPHGVLDARQMNLSPTMVSKKSTDEIWIASYGFFLPHKGLLELIDAFALLLTKYSHLRLRMVNAQYPAPISAQLILEAQEKIAKLGLGEHIDLHTDYLPDVQSLALLQASDLIVFPYQHTGESSSAAVRQGIAAGKPIAVTPLAIFDDVASAAHVLPGTSVSHIAQGLERILQDMQEGQAHFKATEVRAAQWRLEHYYPVLARRLMAMMQGLARA